eukprot:8770567-Alexandrium_andersonii.AAC.1
MKNFTPLCWDRSPTLGSRLSVLIGRPHRADAPSCLLTRVRHSNGCRLPGSEPCLSGAASRRG